MENQESKIKIWEKIPPGVLIPLVVLASLGLAALLIWLGVKLAPVGLLDPEKLSAEKQQEEWRKKRADRGNDNENSFSDTSLPEYQYVPKEKNSEAEEGSLGETNSNSSENAGGDSSAEANDNSSLVKNSSSSTVEENSNSSSTKSTGGSSAAGGSGTSAGCTYPTGDINVWWHSASLKQRDCYISKHGVPVFSQEEPYFCDYEKSEDCYYMKYK